MAICDQNFAVSYAGRIFRCKSNSTTIMGNEWQTVPGPKSKAKAKDSKAKSGQSEGNPASTDPANAVLAQIDADWKQSKLQNGSRAANGAFAGLEVPLYLFLFAVAFK